MFPKLASPALGFAVSNLKKTELETETETETQLGEQLPSPALGFYDAQEVRYIF